MKSGEKRGVVSTGRVESDGDDADDDEEEE